MEKTRDQNIHIGFPIVIPIYLSFECFVRLQFLTKEIQILGARSGPDLNSYKHRGAKITNYASVYYPVSDPIDEVYRNNGLTVTQM